MSDLFSQSLGTCSGFGVKRADAGWRKHRRHLRSVCSVHGRYGVQPHHRQEEIQSVEEQVTRIRDRALGLMNRTEDLVQADMAVFGRFMECYKMPASTDEEKERRESHAGGPERSDRDSS